MAPERRQYRRADTGETLALASDRPLDDVSVLYLARGLPLKVGDTYTIDRYFKADANPIILRVVRPTIKTSGLFGEGGEAELFFSDDAQHTLVQMRSKVPLIGSLWLHLVRTGPATGAATSPAGGE